MKGGELIGQGSYGCVFDPPLLCEGNTVRRKGVVSKLLAAKDAKDEIKENNKISRIDPAYKWHLESYKSCMPKLPTESDDAASCNIIEDSVSELMWDELNLGGTDNSMLKNYRNIVLEHGGTSVSNYISSKPGAFSSQDASNKHFIDLFIQSENLLLGIKDLFEKNMCHFLLICQLLEFLQFYFHQIFYLL